MTFRDAYRWIERERWVSALALFVLVFLLLTVVQSPTVFADPDSFHHIAMAQETRDHGPVRDFRWLPFTVLGQDFSDQHFLYHVALIPFVTLFPPIVGMKLATSLFGALLAVVFLSFLRSLRVPGAWAFTAMLFLTNPFLFRMGLPKASSVSLLLLFLGIWLLFERRMLLLGILTFAYVWTYGGFPLLLVAAVTYAVVSWGLSRLRVGRWHALRQLASRLAERLHKRPRLPNLRAVLVVVIGIVLGILLSPFFPHILKFEQHQLLEVGVVNYRNIIGVGGEWYPYPPRDLLLSAVFVSVIVIIGFILFVTNLRRMRAQSWTALLLFALFTVLTLKSKRYIEYYAPFGIFFGALAIRDALHGGTFDRWWRGLTRTLTKSRWAWFGSVVLTTYIVAAFGVVAVRDTLGVARDLSGGTPVNKFAASAGFLRDHSRMGDVVFHDDWDVFPVLFYHDRVNAYIAGLDATFLYRANPDRYWEWARVTLGTYTGDPYHAVHDVYGARWVHIGKDHGAMHGLIDGRAGFRLAYEDSEAWVYEVVPK
jgi:uncharacterized membrane protein YwzB